MKQSKTFKTFTVDMATLKKAYEVICADCDRPLVEKKQGQYDSYKQETYFKDRKLVAKTYHYPHTLYLHDYRDGHEAKYVCNI